MTETLGEWENRTGLERLADQIDSLPETEEPPVTTSLTTVGAEPLVIEERDYAGLLVQLRWIPGEVSVLVREGENGRPKIAVVPPEKALDAFHHPYCYLA